MMTLHLGVAAVFVTSAENTTVWLGEPTPGAKR
jgi:hypothetical protein